MKEEQHNNFILSIAGPNIDMTIVNIEEMQNYCTQRKRLANVVTHKKTYSHLEQSNYCLIFNYTKPKPLVVNTKNKQFHEVFKVLSERYKGGLLIVESDTLSDAVSDILCNSPRWEENDVDLLICREGLAMATESEVKKADFLRISADPEVNEFGFTRFQDLLQEKTLSLMICQLFVNHQYEEVNRYMDKINERYTREGVKDYVDYYEFNKQLAYFVYFDMKQGKILNVSREIIKAFAKNLHKEGIIPIPEEQLDMFIDMITV